MKRTAGGLLDENGEPVLGRGARVTVDMLIPRSKHREANGPVYGTVAFFGPVLFSVDDPNQVPPPHTRPA